MAHSLGNESRVLQADAEEIEFGIRDVEIWLARIQSLDVQLLQSLTPLLCIE